MRLVMVATASVLLLGGCTVSVAGHPTADPGALPATVAPAAPAGSYGDPAGRFTLVPPPSWVVDTSGASGTAALFLNPRPNTSAAGEFTANVNVLIVPTTAVLPDTVANARQEVASVRGYTSMQDEPFQLADGTPAHLLGGRFTDPSGYALRNVQLVAVRGDRAVVVTGTALADSWDEYAGAFDASLHTITVGAASPPTSSGLAE